jgi:ABC-type sugar transport system substrate-binding protein
MRKITILACAAAIAVAFSAGAAAQGKLIGVSMASDDNPLYIAMVRGIREVAKEKGYEVVTVTANEDIARQLNGIHDLIAKKVSGILISPIDARALCAGYDAAKAANIPIMSIARGSACASQTVHIGVDEIKVGHDIAEWLAKAIDKKGKIAMLRGPQGAQAFQNFAKGFSDTIAKYPDIKVVFSHDMLLTRENGLKYGEDALVAHPDLRAIYGANDDLGLGAAQAVRAANKKKDIVVTGMNGIPPAVRAVKNGEMDMTVALNPYTWGKLGAETMIAYIGGTKPTGGKVFVPHVIVDKTNVDQFLPKQ